MNKTKKITLLSLLGVLLVVCVATFAISRREEKKEAIRNSDEIILSIDPESVTALSWEYDDISLAFHKDEQWQWDDDAAFPVDSEKIAALLEQFSEFGVSFRIEEVEDYGQYGLDSPEAEIHITADDTVYDISLGDYSTMDSERYVSIGNGNVYLVTHDPLDDYSLTIEDMILDDVIPDVSEATALVFEGAESYSVEYEEESGNTYCAEDVYFTDGKPLDTSNVSSYLKTIKNLSTDTYVSYNVSEDELTAYGLDTPELTVTATYPEATEDDEEEPVYESITVSVGRNQAELEEAQESEEENAEDNVTCYFRVNESQIVYQLSSDTYETLMAASYNDLRHEELMTAAFDDIYQIDFTLEDTDYSLVSRTSEEDEDTQVWDCGESEDIDISGIKSAVLSLSAAEFTEEKPKQKEEISFTVYLNNEAYPEIQVALYRYDGDNCLAQLDGKTVSLIPRSSVVDLIEAVNAIVLGSNS